ncbi:unnamed protein product [Mesocestoides corti]|uniref:Ras-GEF domain-containing protein n=1 Tax=Mesocestoides corti TaxID=53468 RepID=A0A158QT03_MESCO|nr:unnamed protein product [Mesocestoides corti]
MYLLQTQEASVVDVTLDLGHSKNDKAASDLMCNIAIADITKVSVDDFAKQITLIDMSYFAAIKRSEFLSLKWNGRDKKIYAPNIVESTKWFNQLNFWVQKEILKYSVVIKRTEMLSFFIKLAKRLVELNNLYSAMSIVSALQVECIYRLRLTWSGLGHRERAAYRRLEELFGQQNNCRLLREHTASMRLPGIPYLGLYLSDLIYTNVAHPRINGQPTTVWVTKLNTIVDAISHFQQSRFPYQVNESIRAYLLAQSYIEELQKFLENANFKASLRLEPPVVLDPPPSLNSNGFAEISRRGNSAVVRVPSTTSSVTAGYVSDQEQGGRRKRAPSFNSPPLSFGCLGEEVEISCDKTGSQSTPTKLSLPPNLVDLLEGGVFCSPTDRSQCKHPESHNPSPSCGDVDIDIGLKPEPPLSCPKKHDREVQVVQPQSNESSFPLPSVCLLCGRQSEAKYQHHQDGSITPTCSLSEAEFSEQQCQSTTEAPVQSNTGKPPPSVSTSRSKSSVVENRDVCSAVLAAVTTDLAQAAINGSTKNRSPSFGLHSRSKGDISHWPPTNLPFITALPAACVLCEGPIRRKTVGRLIPPGLELGTGVMNSSTNSDVCGPWSESPAPSPAAQPQQRYTGNSSWKPFWSALIVLEGWTSAYMVYFEALTKKPCRKEDFAHDRCQIQPFQNNQTESGGARIDSPPSIGLARHRDGSVDESSFLLTHPGLHKTYRIRPFQSSPQKKISEATNFPLTPTPQRRNSRRNFFTLSRKHSATPTHTPSSSSLRERGASAPMLASDFQTIDNQSLPSPCVEDWVHAIQATLDNIHP